MAKLTQDMRDIAGKTKTYILSTASKNGIPNGVPVGLTRIISDEEIMVVDCFMQKTRQNIAENPMAAMTYWSFDDHYGYQIKGSVRVETSGEHFEEGVRWVKELGRPFTPKAVVLITVEDAYYIGADKDSIANLV